MSMNINTVGYAIRMQAAQRNAVNPNNPAQAGMAPAAPTGINPGNPAQQNVPTAAPSQEKPWWQKLGEGIGHALFGAFETVLAVPAAAVTSVVGGVNQGADTGGAWLQDGGKNVWNGFGEIVHAFGSDPQPAVSPEAPPEQHGLVVPTTHRAPRQPKPIAPDAVDTKNPLAVTSFCYRAFREAIGRKPQMSELIWYRDQFQAGKSPRDIMKMLDSHPEAVMNTAAKKALGRGLTETERAMFNNERQDGRTSLGDIVNQLYAIGNSLEGGVGDRIAGHDERNQAAQQAFCRDLTLVEHLIMQDAKVPLDLAAVQAEIAGKRGNQPADLPLEEETVRTYHQDVL